MSDRPSTLTPYSARRVEADLARSDMYLFLSHAFRYPQEEMVDCHKRLPPGTEAATLGGYLEPVEELRRRYLGLLGHTSPSDFPPYETEYGRGQVFQQSQALADISGFYRAFGVEPASGERLDHISVELEFMYYLTYKEAFARQHHGTAQARLCRRAQRRFLEQHLGRWGPSLLQRMEVRAQGFYQELARAAQAFLHREMEQLRVHPQPAGPVTLTGAEEEDSTGCSWGEGL